MERAAAEANIALMSKMLSICREKTLKKNHSSDQLSADEKKQFQNCVLKFFETPNHVMSALNSLGGPQWKSSELFLWTDRYKQTQEVSHMLIH